MLIIPANSASAAGGFDVANSCRFDGSSSYLHKTPTNAGNRLKYTFSTWVKKSKITGEQIIFTAYASNTNHTYLRFKNTGEIRYRDVASDSTNGQLVTSAKFRDPSAWYHVVLVVDEENGTSGNRLILYVNGLRVTQFSTETMPTAATTWNSANVKMEIGVTDGGDGDDWFDGYMAETVFIDGSALAPTDFGEFDEDSGIWKPIKVSGLTFGDEGFFLEFKQAGTSANASGMGADTSGNTNHFTVNNLTAVDQSTDTCTNNFATFNSLTPSLQSGGVVAYSEGNTKIVTAYSNTNYLRYPQAYTTLGVTTGKWYAEFKIGAIGSAAVGIANTGEFGSDGTTNPYAGAANSGAVYTNGGEYRAGAFSDAGSQGTYTEDDIIGCALDLDNLAIYWHKNGTYINSGDPTSGSSKTGARAVQNPTTPGGFYVFTAGADNSGNATIEINLGSPSYSESGGETDGGGIGNFNQAVPSGYFALCTKNIAKHG